MVNKYTEPYFNGEAFTCPHCDTFAYQEWYDEIRLGNSTPRGISYRAGRIENISFCFCSRCKKYSIWIDGIISFPSESSAPLPLDDMPEDVKDDYLEAREIINTSPRGAAALLRLALQKLMITLGETSGNLNEDIGNLVEKGLPVRIQKALDSVRVIGNDAVHPGVLNLKDDTETAKVLFKLINIVVERMIVQPKEIDAIFDELPEVKKKGIENRDSR